MDAAHSQTPSTGYNGQKSGKLALIIIGFLLLISLGFAVWFIGQNWQMLANFFPGLLGKENEVLQTDLDSTQSLDSTSTQAIEENNILSAVSDKDTYQLGETIQVIVNLDTKVEPDGLQFIIGYNPDLVSELKIEEINSFGSFLVSEVDEEAGEIKAVLLRSPNEEVQTSSTLGLLRITATAERKGNLTFSFDRDRAQLAGEAGLDILDNVVDLSVVIN